MQKKWWLGLRANRKPSYIPSRVFALALLDTVAPQALSQALRRRRGWSPHRQRREARTHTSYDLLAKAQHLASHDREQASQDDAPRRAQRGGKDADKFREALERQFDEAMERVSGWYKRRVQLILFVIALVLVGCDQCGQLHDGTAPLEGRRTPIGSCRSGAKNSANKQAKCARETPSGQPKPNSAQVAGKCFDQVKQLNLPLGWSGATSPSTDRR